MSRRVPHGMRGSAADGARKKKPAEKKLKSPRRVASKKGRDVNLIVGIGASAGGLNAFKTFFTHMPADSGMAFILVQHLDPHHQSMLVELLARHTDMTVTEAEDGMRIEANRLHVIPPDATLTVAAGVLRVTRPAPAREFRRPIDTFFASLAEDQGECAVCVVLSGTGSDGTLGLKAIKEHGGLTFAQAEFDTTAMSGMPNSAAATGLVDHILPVEDMPAKLVEYRQHLIEVAGHKDPGGTRADAAEHLPAINAIVRAGTGHDFGHYKSRTLVRRIQRRMQVLQIDSVPAFIARLRKDPHEVELLFREFLIGVTQFFRDPQSFEALQAAAVRPMVEGKKPSDQIRIWVPGCATGEEVYSIAILVKEETKRHGIDPRVQIFGTDIDDAAVAVARAARYRKVMADISPERAERWFAQDGDEYCPVNEIREMCVFSTHSVVKDPPFSKLDLISCRNVMIYLDTNLQDRVMRTFHYALQSGGYLCLGQSESISRNTTLFAAVDKRHRIFQRRDGTPPSLDFLRAAPTVPAPAGMAARGVPRAMDRIDSEARRVLERHSPAYVVIDTHHEILCFSGGEVGRYLEPSAGMASLNLFGIVRRPLRSAVRAAVKKAQASQEAVVRRNMAVKIDGESRSIGVIVEPLPEDSAGAGLCVVAFQDAGPVAAAALAAEGSNSDALALEQELNTTRAQLRATIDELELSNEEMKSTNEEFQSVNEELQSSNEELETSKEEMQSLNEELQTINAEMINKNEVLTRLNSDLKNLLESTQIATLFLDNDLRIQNFTPGMTDIFHLRDTDRGRPITDIVSELDYTDLLRDSTKVLRTLSVVERQVRLSEDGAVYMMRIRPYRTLDNVIDGVVITFVDVTESNRHQEAVAKLAAIVDATGDAVMSKSLDGIVLSWNPGAERLFGYTAQEMVGRPIELLVPPDRSDEESTILDRIRFGAHVDQFETIRKHKNGSLLDISLTVSPIRNADGKTIGASSIAREITARKLAEAQKNILIAELDHRIKNILMTITSLIAQTARSTESPQDFASIVEGRIGALGRVHSLLTQTQWDSAELREVIEGEVAPYRGDNGQNIVLGGKEKIMLTPKATQALAMALHELATNAAKFGALSAPDGKVQVSWSVENVATPPRLSIEWIETGGPGVKPPTRRGFGTQLIEHVVAYDLHADVERVFQPEGVQCRIRLPLTDANGHVDRTGLEEK